MSHIKGGNIIFLRHLKTAMTQVILAGNEDASVVVYRYIYSFSTTNEWGVGGTVMSHVSLTIVTGVRFLARASQFNSLYILYQKGNCLKLDKTFGFRNGGR